MFKLPIFPLDLLVFPGEPVPLHIFEPRYKQLLTDCAPAAGERQYSPFGIVFQGEEGLKDMGCSVVVDEILHKYPGGELDIMTYGQKRFRCLEIQQEELAYLHAEVVWIEDSEPESAPGLRKEVLELYDDFLRVVEVEDLTLERDTEQLLFEIAYRVNMEKEFRIDLMQSLKENERLELVLAYLSETVPQIVKVKEFKRRVRSNGYFV